MTGMNKKGKEPESSFPVCRIRRDTRRLSGGEVFHAGLRRSADTCCPARCTYRPLPERSDVTHLAEHAAVGAGDALDGPHRAVGVERRDPWSGVPVVVHVLRGDLAVGPAAAASSSSRAPRSGPRRGRWPRCGCRRPCSAGQPRGQVGGHARVAPVGSGGGRWC